MKNRGPFKKFNIILLWTWWRHQRSDWLDHWMDHLEPHNFCLKRFFLKCSVSEIKRVYMWFQTPCICEFFCYFCIILALLIGEEYGLFDLCRRFFQAWIKGLKRSLKGEQISTVHRINIVNGGWAC